MTKKGVLLCTVTVLLMISAAVGAQAWRAQYNQKAVVADKLIAEMVPEPEKAVEVETEEIDAPVTVEEETEPIEEKEIEAEVEPAPAPEKTTETPKVAQSGVRANRSGSAVTTVPPKQEESEPAPAPEKKAEEKPVAKPPADDKITYTEYTVKQGDSFWGISQQVGIPLPELLKVNNMTEGTPLYVGMALKIPHYQIAPKATPGPQYGELLDWWTEAQYVWPIGQNAKIIDFATGKSFMARRSYGAFHADVEPLTKQDNAIMLEIWGGRSWTTRPVIVEIGGRRLAASSHGMPHSIQTITDNNFEGHFCVHFLNSTRHKDNLMQEDHQRNVRTAAGQ